MLLGFFDYDYDYDENFKIIVSITSIIIKAFINNLSHLVKTIKM